MGGGRRGGKKREPERRPKRPTKDLFVTTLHRRPCRWDLIAYELAGALGGAYAKVRPTLAPGGLRFDSDDVPTVGLMLAQGFEVVLRRAVRDEPNGPAARCLDAGAFGPDEADALASRAAADAFGPLLRKYAEDVYDVILPRPDRDLARLSEGLAAALRLVLGRCGPGGDLASSLADPLAPARGDLPDNGLPPDPARPSGLGRARDVLLLAPTVHASDDAGEAKRKLVHFTRHDPWLFAESLNYVLDRQDEADPDDWDVDPSIAIFGATDDFLYRATRVDGLTPIELFVARQPDPDAPNCRRLLRWGDEVFSGLFEVRRVEVPLLWLRDLEDDREYEVFTTRPEALKGLRPRELFFTRLVPWDAQWTMSGVQQKWGTPRQEDLAEIKEKLKFAPPHKRPAAARDDDKARQALELQAAQHRTWVELYGADDLVFEDGRAMEAALSRHMRYWSQEARDPATGMTRAEQYEREHDRPAPDPELRLPDELREARGVGLVFDPAHGIFMLPDYAAFRSALESAAPPTRHQAAVALDYLRGADIHYTVWLRARERSPAGLERLVRAALRDEEFSAERDLEPLLRKYKGDQMRRPPEPSVTVV